MAEDWTQKGSTEPQDLDLVRRVQRGDSSAFDLLVRKYQHRIVGLIGRYVSDWSECQDVAQDTFIRAYRAIGNFRGDAAFSTWLYQIATNLARNRYWYWWRRKRDKTVSFDQPLGDDSDSATLAEIIPAEEHLYRTMRPRATIDVAKQWQETEWTQNA